MHTPSEFYFKEKEGMEPLCLDKMHGHWGERARCDFNAKMMLLRQPARVMKSGPGGWGIQNEAFGKDFNRKMMLLRQPARVLKSGPGGRGL